MISNATDLQIITIIALDPALLIGLFLFIFEKVRPKFYLVFFWVAFIHIALFISHPIKDEFWINFLTIQIVIDAVVLLGFGLFLKSRNKNQKKMTQTRLNYKYPLGVGWPMHPLSVVHIWYTLTAFGTHYLFFIS